MERPAGFVFRWWPNDAIFRAFKPERIEYVLKGTETDEEIDALVNRGLTPVMVTVYKAEAGVRR